ncbi:MAG: HAMP domain-containing histidine kinase [Clostridiales bacterium]|nr:HAMP domain-containing histidine kinase [Clostridiales bacterium]
MIKKLQRRFIFICLASVLAILIVFIGAINISTAYSSKKDIDNMLSTINRFGGDLPGANTDSFPNMPVEDETSPGSRKNARESESALGSRDNSEFDVETKYKTRYFTIEYDLEKNMVELNTENIAAVTEESAVDYADAVMSKGKTYGKQGIYVYELFENQDGYLLVFLDCSSEIQNLKDLMLKSNLIALAAIALLSVIIALVSPKAIKPFVDNMEKQKQFITDASHEIKTPIAIISANADVLSLSGNDNEWVRSIKHQTNRLSELVNDLVALAKLDEESKHLVEKEFNLSKSVSEAVEQFSTLAEIEGKTITANIQPDIIYKGDEKKICQLEFILLDNAIKYSTPEDNISVSLGISGKNIVLSVENKCEDINKDDLKHIFDRFYRADKSRSRKTGGYGIGLSLANAIVETHHGTITAKSKDGQSVVFTVTL